MLYYIWGTHWPKYVHLPSLVHLKFKASMGAMSLAGPSAKGGYICQVLCTGIQGIYA